MSQIRLGLFLCECGGEISNILDMESLERAVSDLPGLIHLQRLSYPCLPEGLEAMRGAIVEKGLNRVVVAGCTPRTMAAHLRAACSDAGLDGNWMELVDIREGCAWAHSDEPQAATEKAVDLIRMGAAMLYQRGEREVAVAEVLPAALVIGGGLAGMTAALMLGEAGISVKLVEREQVLGGGLRDVYTLYPDGVKAGDLLQGRATALHDQPCVQVILGKEVTAVSGTVGRYTVQVDGVRGSPSDPTTFDVGAIIVAIGARQWRPAGRYRHDGQRVLTQVEFERVLENAAKGGGDTVLPRVSQLGSGAGDVVMLLCAGPDGHRMPYCSRVCCLGAIQQAIEVKQAWPQSNVTILFGQLYLPGKEAQAQYERAKRLGVRFVPYLRSSPPVVFEDAVQIEVRSTGRKESIPYDRLILATPLIPQEDAGVLAHMLELPQDENGFFPAARYRLRPENVVDRGVYVCGAAHFPADWQEAEFQAMSAAFSAMRHLRAGTVASRAPFAIVDEDLCTGCGNCVSSCAFDAISMQPRQGVVDVSHIDPLLCKGCGNCAVVCPVKAIRLPLESDAAILAQIDAALARPRNNGEVLILSFGCEWSGYAAAEIAGARKMSYPSEVRQIQVGCSARLDPLHLLWALLNGADGVFVAACPPGDCHYVNGNQSAQQRLQTLQRLLRGNGFDCRRVRLEWIHGDDPEDFVHKVTDFAQLVGALGPSSAGDRYISRR
jgi:heterodisulfide reductase subunit A